MGVRRDKEDPVLTEYVRERFAQLLAENVPRRAHRQEPSSRADPPVRAARPSDPSARVAQRIGSPSLAGDGPPDFEPSDDEALLPDPVGRPRGGPAPLPGPGAEARLGRGRAREGEDVADDPLDGMEDVAPRPPFRRAHVGVVAVLLVVGLLCAGWSVLRARPVAIASTPAVTAVPTVLATAGPRSGAAASTTPSTKASVQILVHVLGAVRHPGVVQLPERARVQDAIDAAGGLRREARPGELNLAQVLTDGQQVVIGTAKKPTAQVRDGAADPSTGSTQKDSPGTSALDLNTATEPQLEALPGVGPVTAGKIVAWREQHSRFSRVEELQEIDGIGPKTYAEIAPHVRV